MRALVTFAVEAEFASWRKLREFKPKQVEDLTVHQAQIGRAQVQVLITGMGSENARRGMQAVATLPQTICISSGFAGALKRDYRVGDILVAHSVQELGGHRTLECARRLNLAAFYAGAKRAKMFLTSSQVIATTEEKKQLGIFADAVDMESYAVIEEARCRSLPAVAIRVISDTVDQEMPIDFSQSVDPRGRVALRGILRQIARRPQRLPAVMRLGLASVRAATVLAEFLDPYIKNLSFRSHGEFPVELRKVAVG
ncbi:MAG: hypothetical protein HY234_09685 [Acidobacteria bacterium]|nr:hypothetical protein [Acidobacteriota bacterium]MBI3663306.1 hypothetical protein [Acidobacteriota bacterium]